MSSLGFSSNSDLFKAFKCIISLDLKKGKPEKYLGSTIVDDIVNEQTGEILCESNTELNPQILDELKDAGISSIEVVDGNKNFEAQLILNTIVKDPSHNTEAALGIVYRRRRRGTPDGIPESLLDWEFWVSSS